MLKNNKLFITIFPNYKNYHFFKDPGQIPYRFRSAGYNAKIVCYNNEKDYYETQKYIPVTIIPNIRLTPKINLGMILYLVFNSRKIDYLSLFHITWDSLLYSFIYKLINPSGFVYLKMDNCHYCGTYQWEKILDPDKQPMQICNTRESKKQRIRNRLIKKYFVHKVDLWSVEDESSRKYYEKHYPFFKDKLITILNGHSIDLQQKLVIKTFSEKENIISTVSNLGTYPKATDILLEAFQIIAQRCNWNLHLAGNIATEFDKYIKNYFYNYPELKDRVIFHGLLGRDKLYDLYNRSKIFCLPSRFEGFANVFAEALYFQNAIITTHYVSLRDLIKENKMGLLVEKDDSKELSAAIFDLISDEEKIIKMGINSREFAIKKLDWISIIAKLEKHMR